MSEVSTVSISDIQKVAESVNSLKSEGMIFLVVMTLIIIIYMILDKFFAWRKESQISEQKNKRIEAQLLAFTKLSDNLNVMKSELEVQGAMRISHFGAMIEAQGRINTQLTDMNKKIRGIIPDVDASNIIKVYFNNIIRREVSYLVEAQIIENGFIENSDFIRVKMKTNIGELLRKCSDELKGLKLPLAVKSIFISYHDDDGERFQICDLIWEPIAIILASKKDKSKKIEEAKIVISNVVNDYINPIIKDLTESPSGMFEALVGKKSE
jgi:hypothetical protein